MIHCLTKTLFFIRCSWMSICFSFFQHVLQPTVPAEGRSPPRIGNIGHLTHISNKLVQLANSSSEIQSHLQVSSIFWNLSDIITILKFSHVSLQQENTEWNDWQTNVLLKRNALENVYQWACGYVFPLLFFTSFYYKYQQSA